MDYLESRKTRQETGYQDSAAAVYMDTDKSRQVTAVIPPEYCTISICYDENAETAVCAVKSNPENEIFFAIISPIRAKDNVNIRNIRLSHLKYMLLFPLAPVFAIMQDVLFSDSIRLFGLDAMTLTGSAYCIEAGVFFAFADVQNMATASRVFSVCTLTTFVAWLAMPESMTWRPTVRWAYWRCTCQSHRAAAAYQTQHLAHVRPVFSRYDMHICPAFCTRRVSLAECRSTILYYSGLFASRAQ